MLSAGVNVAWHFCRPPVGRLPALESHASLACLSPGRAMNLHAPRPRSSVLPLQRNTNLFFGGQIWHCKGRTLRQSL